LLQYKLPYWGRRIFRECCRQNCKLIVLSHLRRTDLQLLPYFLLNSLTLVAESPLPSVTWKCLSTASVGRRNERSIAQGFDERDEPPGPVVKSTAAVDANALPEWTRAETRKQAITNSACVIAQGRKSGELMT